MSTDRKFPIQRSHDKSVKPYPMEIPWSVAELAYSVYVATYGEGNLERIAERGGFGPEEMDRFLPDWRERTDEINLLRAERDNLLLRIKGLEMECHLERQRRVYSAQCECDECGPHGDNIKYGG